MTNKNFFSEITDYYAEKLKEKGETALGVDWGSEERQQIVFAQLCKIINKQHVDYSINDLGCGYGALYDYLSEHHVKLKNYYGIDVTAQMIDAARVRYKNHENVNFVCANYPAVVCDYSIACGIFSVRQSQTDAEWLDYIKDTLDSMNDKSKLGFAFNCLTKYSDTNKKRNYLYYADPCELFDWCKRNYSKQVALLHDYGFYEFTILVSKE